MRCFKTLVAAALALCAGFAQAHKASDAYVQLSGGGAFATHLRVDLALRDIDVALDLDANGDGKLTWGEVRAAWPAIELYVRAHVGLEGCDLGSASRSLERRVDGVYAALQFQSDCRPPTVPSIRYSMLAEVDPTHRGIARIEWAGSAQMVRVLVPTLRATAASMPAASSTSARDALGIRRSTDPSPENVADAASTADSLQFLREGVRHILTGYDHVLFLLCLLLPSVMRRSNGRWEAVDRWSQAALPLLGIVTSFTVAHSITLALAATGTVSLPPSFIEPAIAVTIILAALDNVWPVFRERRAVVTFLFGLIHGFGFAGVLAELHLPTGQFALALLQFNLGLELGQLLIVIVATSALFAVRRRSHYATFFIRGGSVAAMAVGGIWLVERTANVSLMPF